MPLSHPILKTKFFIPGTASDFVVRKELIVKLNRLTEIPILLVSAPTGYGKSSLVADFIQNQSANHAWLSLGEKDNDFLQFIRYFVTALQNGVSDICSDILELTTANEPPSSVIISELLINCLADLSQPLIIVLDDYHHIHNRQIHEFISQIFEYPLPHFHLVVITRRDPELPLSKWRSKNKLIDIRSADLKFNKEEIYEFCNLSLHIEPNDDDLNYLMQLTDGWVSGLRMLTLTVHDKDELKRDTISTKYKNSHVIQQLVDTVLQNQEESTKEWLLKLSILKEFNVDLFASLCLEPDQMEEKELIFNRFISSLVKSNFFIIALDDKHNWYRFHHWFTEQLQMSLKSEFEDCLIKELNTKAAAYFGVNQIYDDAIEIYLSIDNIDRAIELFSAYRIQLLNESKFQELERVLKSFASGVIQRNGILKLTEAWLLMFKGSIAKMAELLDPTIEMLHQEDIDDNNREVLLGEIYALKAYVHYQLRNEIPKCVEYCRKAIAIQESKNQFAVGLAWIFYGAAMQILKNSSEAKAQMHSELNRDLGPTIKAHILITLCYIDWFEGDLKGLVKTADHLLQHGKVIQQKMVMAHANCFTGMAYYYQNNEEMALKHLNIAFELKYFSVQPIGFPAAVILMKMLASRGDLEMLKEVQRECERIAFERGDKRYDKILAAAKSEMNWNLHHNPVDLTWAKENDYKDYLPLVDLYSPEITQAKLLIFDGQPDSLKLSLDILDQMIAFFEGRNNIMFLNQAYLIKAAALSKLGDSKLGSEYLERSINISKTRNYTLPFIELADILKEMLLDFKQSVGDLNGIDGVFQLLPKDKVVQQKLLLSIREKEILQLSADHTNKEVGNELFISETTVKRHLANIYKKLNSNSKQEALIKAQELNIF